MLYVDKDDCCIGLLCLSHFALQDHKQQCNAIGTRRHSIISATLGSAIVTADPTPTMN